MKAVMKLSIWAVVAIGALAVSAIGALAAPAVATSDTQLRDDASYSADFIDTVDAGDPVDVQDCTYSWCYVDHDGTEGWIRKSKLAFTGYPHHHPHPVEPGVGFGVDLGDGGGISLSLDGSG
jgi:uncharacterized protein YraI